MTFKPSFKILRPASPRMEKPMGIRPICRRSWAILIHGPHSRSIPGLSALRSFAMAKQVANRLLQATKEPDPSRSSQTMGVVPRPAFQSHEHRVAGTISTQENQAQELAIFYL